MTAPPLLAMLCRANLGVLNQKIVLMDVMRTTFGEMQSKEMFQHVCPIVKASIGQHFRHSMDHVELAMQALTADSASQNIHYDIRRRGGPDEYDIDEAQIRIQMAMETLTNLSELTSASKNDPQSVQACFMLSADSKEFQLPSTVLRELGFSAHHGIHHMAMVRIIALETLKLPLGVLPPDFGKAPSTIAYDKSASNQSPQP